MIGQADIDDIDTRRRQIIASGDDVQPAVSVVRLTINAVRESMRGQDLNETDSRRSVGSVKSYVRITDQKHWVNERGEAVQYIRDIVKERRRDPIRPRSIDDRSNAGRRARRDTDAQKLKRRWFSADVE